MMPEYKVTYVTYRPSPRSNFYAYEVLKARGIKHANKLAKDHAEALGSVISSIKQMELLGK